jgi:hypothetical protein
MTRHAAISDGRRRPEDHPDSVLPDDDTVRDEESTPPDHTETEGVEQSGRAEPRDASEIPHRRRAR